MKKLISAVAMVAVMAITAPGFAQSMNGNWEVTNGTLHGKAVPPNVAFTMTLDIASTNFTANSGNMSSTGTVTANPQASPAQVMFKIDNGNDPGRELKGIYKMEGQIMTITFSENDQYPASFDSTADNKYLTLSYQISTGRNSNNNSGGLARNQNNNRSNNNRTRRTTPPPARAQQQNDGSAAAAF